MSMKQEWVLSGRGFQNQRAYRNEKGEINN